MRKSHIAAILIVICVVALVAYAGWRRGGPNQFETAFNPGGTVTLDLSTGDFRVEGTADNHIRVEPNLTNRGEVRCLIEVSGANAKVQVDGPNNNFHATIYVPQRSDLNVDQTIGHLLVRNVIGNQNLGLDIGKMDIELPKQDTLPNFEGGVIMGALHPNPWHVEKGGFFRSFSSRSSSRYSVVAHLDIGDLSTYESTSYPQQPEDAGHDMPQQNTPYQAH